MPSILHATKIEGLEEIKIGKAMSTIKINQKRTKNCALKSIKKEQKRAQQNNNGKSKNKKLFSNLIVSIKVKIEITHSCLIICNVYFIKCEHYI